MSHQKEYALTHMEMPSTILRLLPLLLTLKALFLWVSLEYEPYYIWGPYGLVKEYTLPELT